MRFSQIALLIPAERHDQHLISYYDSIKNLNGCANNQFFWLQYAIARLSISDYGLAEKYLETAYGLAKKISGFDTYQIDNTKARLLLQRIADGTRVGKSFADFVEASRILNQQARSSGQGYYPFRVASLYQGILPRITTEWSADQMPIFFAACRGMAERLDKIDSRLVDHPDIVRCREVMRELLKQA